MSVRDISPQEVQGIYLRCLLEPELLGRCCFVPEERLAQALIAVYAANKATQHHTYGEPQSIAAFDVTAGSEAADLDLVGLFEALGNLLYNCVSNSGHNFLPAEHEATVEAVRLGIGRKALEKLRQADKGVKA